MYNYILFSTVLRVRIFHKCDKKRKEKKFSKRNEIEDIPRLFKSLKSLRSFGKETRIMCETRRSSADVEDVNPVIRN